MSVSLPASVDGAGVVVVVVVVVVICTWIGYISNWDIITLY